MAALDQVHDQLVLFPSFLGLFLDVLHHELHELDYSEKEGSEGHGSEMFAEASVDTLSDGAADQLPALVFWVSWGEIPDAGCTSK